MTAERAVFFSDGDADAPPRRTLAGVEHVADATPGAWLVASMTTFAKTLASFLPGHFDAYARVFHPVNRGWPRHEETVTWREIAAAAGEEFNECLKCEPIVEREGDAFAFRSGDNGSVLPALVETLTPETSTPAKCYFALWEGYAGTIPHEKYEPTLILPGRKHHVYRGAVDAALVNYDTYSGFVHHFANLWWPADHAWCVATPIYSYSTFVGGSRASIDTLLADTRLESVETFAARTCW